PDINKVTSERVAFLRSTQLITDADALRKLVIVFSIVIALFLLQDILSLQPGYVAFAGAALALLWLRPDPEAILKEVEWSALLFFACLFVVVGGLEAAGVMNAVARFTTQFAGANTLLSAVLLIWI